MGVYDDIVDFLSDELPYSAKTFLARRRNPSDSTETWNYFSYSYENGFVALVEAIYGKVEGHEHLLPPLYMLGRQSMELSLKAAIAEFPPYTKIPPLLDGHNLPKLFEHLCQQIRAMDYFNDSEWTWKVRELVEHIHQFDPKGDRFRYPQGLDGMKYRHVDITFTELVKAHGLITVFADASADELHLEKGIPLEQRP
ncbi:hypothetical protein NKJ09_22055 [Mesorhizobium sp. M0189]|uniref:hypothetical protein n=1 Tax=unclassified Mesorhizobium TaxID=325217 RepID=UPI0033364D4C